MRNISCPLLLHSHFPDVSRSPLARASSAGRAGPRRRHQLRLAPRSTVASPRRAGWLAGKRSLTAGSATSTASCPRCGRSCERVRREPVDGEPQARKRPTPRTGHRPVLRTGRRTALPPQHPHLRRRRPLCRASLHVDLARRACLSNIDQASGGMAQLVARLHGMEKVRGSNPLTSTAGRWPRTSRSGAFVVSAVVPAPVGTPAQAHSAVQLGSFHWSPMPLPASLAGLNLPVAQLAFRRSPGPIRWIPQLSPASIRRSRERISTCAPVELT